MPTSGMQEALKPSGMGDIHLNQVTQEAPALVTARADVVEKLRQINDKLSQKRREPPLPLSEYDILVRISHKLSSHFVEIESFEEVPLYERGKC